MNRSLRIMLFGGTIALLAAFPAKADIVYNNLVSCTPGTLFCTASGQQYDGGSGYTLGDGFQDGNSEDSAMAFTPTGRFSFDGFQLAATQTTFAGVPNAPNVIDVSLLSDAGGSPGAVLETFHLVDAMDTQTVHNDGSLAALVAANSVTHPILEAGTQYWLMAEIDTPTAGAWWQSGGPANNPPGASGTVAQRSNNGPWNVSTNISAAFEITGTPLASVPLPSTTWLLGIALVAIGFTRRGKLN